MHTSAQADDPQNGISGSMADLDTEDAVALANVGVLLDDKQRSGTFVLQDAHTACVTATTRGLELLPIAEALKKHAWLRENYYWKAVPADLDEVTAQCAAEAVPQGYFAHVHKGAKVTFPCQTGLYMTHGKTPQKVHNVVILDKDAELELITGCLTALHVIGGMHLAVTEMYIGKNATLTNTMIHSWGPDVEVHPRAATVVEEGGTFVSNYVSLRTAKSIELNPRTWLNGRGASAKYYTIILGSKGSTIETGGVVYLNGEDSSAELVHRGVGTGGRIYQKGLLIGNNKCRAHVDCAGMLLDPTRSGFIQSMPSLKGVSSEAQMSHEASIGKIAPEQVEYLQSRGLNEQEAISMIIRGFLEADVAGLGPELDARVAEIAELAGHGEKS